MKKLFSGIMLTLLLASLLTLAFNIQSVKGDYVWTETIYVLADGSIQPSTAPVSSVDNVTYTLTDNIAGNVPDWSSAIIIQRNNTIIDGGDYTLQGTKAFGSRGIELTGRSNVTIKNMKITAFDYGVWLNSSSNNSISGNNVTNNWDGIYLWVCSDNSVSGNNITANYGGGIVLDSSYNNSVSGNTEANSEYGIYIYYFSSNNSISGNNITANYGGIYFWICSDNIVSGNNIANNGYGIQLDFSRSSNNTIYHNDFINNTYQVFAWAGSTNVWDDGYPSGGNYWSDYTDVDLHSGPHQNETGSDGMGDAPYHIDQNNQDNYPLMKPYLRPPGDVNGDRKVDMQDISLLIDAFLSYPEHPRWNLSADINKDNSVDMLDISITIDHFMQP